MKYLFVILALLPLTLHAAPPSCWPGESTASAMLPTFVADDQENCAAVWFCAGDHKWARYAIYGHGNNVDNCDYGYLKAVAALFMTHEQKDALWNERFVTGAETDPVKLSQYQAQDAPARVLAFAVPSPTHAPPSGWVTQTTDAYKRSESIGKYSVVKVGTVPIGRPCQDTNSIQDANGVVYHALVNRFDATMTKVGNYTPTYPTTLYGRCMP